MKILVDADACPVKEIILETAREFGIRVLLVTDTSHQLSDSYAEVITVDKSRDSADFAIISRLEAGDIVVTQDYGLAAMAMPKAFRVIHQNGFVYHSGNIDRLLFERHLSQKQRRTGGRTRGPAKRTRAEDEAFRQVFRRLVQEARKLQ